MVNQLYEVLVLCEVCNFVTSTVSYKSKKTKAYREAKFTFRSFLVLHFR